MLRQRVKKRRDVSSEAICGNGMPYEPQRHRKTGGYFESVLIYMGNLFFGYSGSIFEQKRILEAYAKQNGFSNLKWYTDDGYSGANFQRPGFQSMLADIEAGLVGTVIVKDMSRLGRNYLQVGMYIELHWTRA